MFPFKRKQHIYTEKIFKVLLEKKFKKAYINKIIQENDVIKASIHIPASKALSDLEEILPNLQQELCATAIKIGRQKGKNVEVWFGMKDLGSAEDIKNKKPKYVFDKEKLHPQTLKIYFPSAFGEYILDFEDDGSCHILNGGTTRMGKTTFYQYLLTTLYLQTNGEVIFYVMSAKTTDFYFLKKLPNMHITKEHADVLSDLNEIIDEYKRRGELLENTPELGMCTNAKDVRETAPHYFHEFKPIFVVIDEFGRYADNPSIKKAVEEIVETAGYVNVHVIMASQRPDVVTVLTSRIRVNMLVRFAFHVPDEGNRKVILGLDDVPDQGKIAGRAIVVDGGLNTVQVPFLNHKIAYKLLEPYRKEFIHDEQDTEGQLDTPVIDPLQGMLSESISLPSLSGEFESSECSEQSLETPISGWSLLASSERA